MIRLLLATRNVHKAREIAEIFGDKFCLTDLTSHPQCEPAEETGATFEENARLKARAISQQASGLVLADDSGLEVDSLGGAPGIFSARYAGGEANDEANRKKLREELSQLPPGTPHTARFRCALALARAGEVLAVCEGVASGEIVREPRGAGGFGYDPLFRPDGFTETFAQLPAATKNSISHRGRAARRMIELLLAIEPMD